MEHTEAERNAEYESRWRRGGLSFYGSFADLLTDPQGRTSRPPNSSTTRSARSSRIRQRPRSCAPRQRSAASGSASTLAIAPPSTGPTSDLVDLRATLIAEITPSGLRTSEAAHDLDDLILACSFDLLTRALAWTSGALADSHEGRLGGGAKNYLRPVRGRPQSLHHICGPGSPSVLTNMLPSIEQHVNWIGQTVDYLRRRGLKRIEAKPENQEPMGGACQRDRRPDHPADL